MNMIRPVPVDMQPHYNGLFTIERVATLAAKRGLLVYGDGDLFEPPTDKICIIQHGQAGKPVHVVAQQDGMWSPVDVFSKCREALGKPSYVIGHARITNPPRDGYRLNEVVIASVLGADGINPYLTRKTEHFVCHLEDVERFWLGPIVSLLQEYIRTNFPKFHGCCKVTAYAGDWTLPMLYVMCQVRNAGRSLEYRRALYALSESGLIDLTMGGKGGIGTATYEWADLAKIHDQKMAEEDAAALNAFAA